MADTIKLSASHIRYLLVIKSLEEQRSGVRNVDLAAQLGVSKPSAHIMLKTLGEMNLVSRQKKRAVSLTPEGSDAANRCGRYYQAVFELLSKYTSTDDSTFGAICSLIAEMSENSLERLCINLQNEVKEIQLRTGGAGADRAAALSDGAGALAWSKKE